jgi:hypothetical protein
LKKRLFSKFAPFPPKQSVAAHHLKTACLLIFGKDQDRIQADKKLF